jgi:hypothetical protein
MLEWPGQGFEFGPHVHVLNESIPSNHTNVNRSPSFTCTKMNIFAA